jgi:ABC-type multidrug transport system permease subunit
MHYKRNIHKKSTFLITLLLPVLAVLLGAISGKMSNPVYHIGILESGHTTKSNTLITTFNSMEGITTDIANAKTLQTDLRTGNFTAIVEFQPDGSYLIHSVKDKKIVDSINILTDSALKMDTAKVSFDSYSIKTSPSSKILAFMLMFLMVTSTLNATLFLKDKTSGTFLRYLYSSRYTISYLLGNMLYNFIITYLQFFLGITLARFLIPDLGISYGSLLLLGIWLSGLAASFATWIASMFKNDMYANQSSSGIVLLFSLIGGTFIPYPQMPDLLQRLSVISPIRWFLETITSVEQGNPGLLSNNSLIILTVFIAGFLFLAVSGTIYQKKSFI